MVWNLPSCLHFHDFVFWFRVYVEARCQPNNSDAVSSLAVVWSDVWPVFPLHSLFYDEMHCNVFSAYSVAVPTIVTAAQLLLFLYQNSRSCLFVPFSFAYVAIVIDSVSARVRNVFAITLASAFQHSIIARYKMNCSGCSALRGMAQPLNDVAIQRRKPAYTFGEFSRW